MKLPAIHVGHGTHAAGLTVFPLWTDAPTLTGISWNPARLQVAEREGSPVVEELVVGSASARALVALEGDLLKGGMQDRMLAASTLLAPHERRVMEVVCVEHGRWSSASGAPHDSAGRRGALSVRHGNIGRRDEGEHQHEVWRRIGRYEETLGATASASMMDHLSRSEPPTVRQLPGQRGVVIGIGGRIIGAEIFGSASGLAARWQGILDAAWLDAHLLPPFETRSEDARRFARRLAAMNVEDVAEAGLARRLRSELRGVRLDGVGRDGALIHGSAFDESHPLLENA